MIVQDNNKSVPIGDPRIAGMIRWILANVDSLVKPENVQVVFNCAGPRSISTEVKVREVLDPALLVG